MKNRALMFSLIAFSIMLLSGCTHTAEGFGQDMQNTGKAIQKSMSGN